MKLYELKKKQKELSDEISDLFNRFKLNNCVKIEIERDYNPVEILQEIEEKSKELEKITFKIYRYEINIKELIIQNDIYSNIIKLLKETPTKNNLDYSNTYNRLSLDNIIKEYKDKINKNLDTIDYYYFITEDND